MPDSRLVRCKDPDCAYEWESSARDPRCSDPDDICGRSRAEPVADLDGSTPQASDGGHGDGSTASTDASDDDDGWTPLFSSRDASDDSADDPPDPPSLGTDDDGGDDDRGSAGPGMDDIPEEMPDLDADDVRPFLVSVFGGPPQAGDQPTDGMLSTSRGEHWRLKDHELDNLGKAYAKVGNKYLPYMVGNYTVEFMALFATATVCMPRLQEDRRQAKENDEPNVDPEEGGPRNEQEEEETEPASVDIERSDTEAWTAGAKA